MIITLAESSLYTLPYMPVSLIGKAETNKRFDEGMACGVDLFCHFMNLCYTYLYKCRNPQASC